VVFNSLVFVVFCAVFFPTYHSLRRQRERLWLLTIASFVFYGYWDWRFLPLLLGSALVDHQAGLLITRRPSRRRLWLGLSLAVNLGTLGFFKYASFGLANARPLFEALGLGSPSLAWQIVLPVGISFYTFQSMSYTIDVYRGRLEPEKSFLAFLASLSFFPQLVAGPILRARSVLPQLAARRTPGDRELWLGYYGIAKGLFKKCVIADNLALAVDAGFASDPSAHQGLYWWLIAGMFAFQIYCDFSGYSDIAIGLARWMGIEISENFDHPYLSSSFREFWQRWHISLSTWFRDYVYLPLGGGYNGTGRSHLNLWITMLLSGLWHGASWHFVAWGGAHAALLSIERLTRWPARLERRGSPGKLVSVVVVFALSTLCWVLFRAETVELGLAIIGQMLDPVGLVNLADARAVGGPGLTILAIALCRHAWVGSGLGTRLRGVLPLGALEPIAAASLLVATVYLRGPGRQFIYFQF
jgi:alginate O-acetyltransferase complex protein AlgI